MTTVNNIIQVNSIVNEAKQAAREAADTETHVTIRGTVKRHNDRSTQLNRVKIVGELA